MEAGEVRDDRQAGVRRGVALGILTSSATGTRLVV
jgi:hypothetical protein